MVVKVGNKEVTIKDTDIKNFMKRLDITEEEAIQMYLEDEGYEVNEEVENLTAKAKANGTAKIVAQSGNRKKTERKPKENPLKTAIINDLYNFLAKNSTLLQLNISNPTKSIDFIAESKEFTINLVEHRPKKA